MQLNKVEDFRDCLEKATRWELTQFAKARGVSEIDPEMPAILMRQILRAREIVDIEAVFPALRRRQIGQLNGVNATGKYARGGAEPAVPQVNAVDLLVQQWKDGKARSAPIDDQPPSPTSEGKAKNAMAELRKECKRRGIKMSRRDNMASLRAKLDGEQDASASG